MKNDDVNNKPVAIILLSLLFLVGGIAALYASFITKAIPENVITYIKIGGVVFSLLGLLLMIVGIIRAKKLGKIKKLLADPSAFATTAQFVGSKFASYTSTTVGLGNVDIPTSMNVYKKVIYSYTDENGVSHTVKSAINYFSKQVKQLEEMQTFRIKCKGNISVITEPLEDPTSRFNF